ncbi:MAG: hypothetical protein K8T89_02520 [Planctomycetes bacterium]|nr:hypothetical protein [Planctomycetota bacterium]
MMRSNHQRSRHGTVLPLLAICLTGLMAFVALAIDIGVMAVARNQAQNAADISALAGARTLDGKSVNNNLSAAVTMSQTTATSNSILNTPITTAQVTTAQGGIYRYDTTAQRFQAVFGSAPGTNESYGVIQVKLTTQQPTFFAKVMGVGSLTVAATATAVHRPRDIAIVLDFSGSMGYSSRANNPSNSTSMNPDSRFPRFGPWSIYGASSMVKDIDSPGTAPSNLNTYSPPTPLQRIWAYVDGSGYLYAPNNHTIDMPGGPAIVGQFLQSDNSTKAFVSTASTFPTFTNVNVSTSGNPTTIVTPAPDEFSNQSATGFVGDKFPLRSGQTVSGTTAPSTDQYAHTVWRILNTSASGAGNTTVCLAWEDNGYDATYTGVSGTAVITATATAKAASDKYQGFTMGPGYWGKTFYMWPPDPRTPVAQIGETGYVAGDWRRRFFLPRSGSGDDMRDNSVFWNSSGRWRQQAPGTAAEYIVNYDNILAWMSKGPQTLPPSLRCGLVVYYDTMPTTIPISMSTGNCTSSASNDQRFWKDYIDYVIGAGRWTDSSSLYGAGSANSNTGGGSTLHYNQTSTALTPQITSRATLLAAAGPNSITGATKASPIVITSNAHGLTTGRTVTVASVGGNTAANGSWTITVVDANRFSLNGSTGNASYTSGGNWKIVPYMHYGDSPVHPRMQFWFGPQSMMAYLQEPGNWFPGNCYEAQSWQLKAGINSAIDDIKSNHPNDLASIIFFSGSDGYNTARVSMSKEYTKMKNSLFYPFSLLDSLGTASSTIRPYGTTSPSNSNPAGLTDTTDTEIPNAGTSTCPQMGFMVAFNQTSSASTFAGRKTASKVIIYETDGLPNTSCDSGSLSGGYYTNISAGSNAGLSTSLHVASKDNARAVVKQFVALTTANPPGYSTTRNPARVHAIAFGDLFESYSTSAYKVPALQFLAAVQIDGNTSPTPTGTWDTDSLDYNTHYLSREPYKLIIGDYNTRIDKIREALERIMQGGVQIALIQ